MCDPDDDRPSIIVMWRLIGKVVVDFFCGCAPFILLGRAYFGYCLPAPLYSGRCTLFQFLVVVVGLCGCQNKAMSSISSTELWNFSHTLNAIRLLIFSNRIATRTNTPCSKSGFFPPIKSWFFSFKIRRGPKLEGCAFANFGNSSGTEGEPSQKIEKNGKKFLPRPGIEPGTSR